MKAGTDLAQVGSLVGDPARANMLAALMGGAALTASELAMEAGVGLSTASSHLSKLTQGGLIGVSRQGRHRYYRLADDRVASMLESIMGVAAVFGPKRVLPGPRDGAMREARICYDHLAGEYGVAMFDGFVRRGYLVTAEENIAVTADGERYFAEFGIELPALRKGRRPLCRTCLDWSVRRTHLAGALGAAMLDRMIMLHWVRRETGSRVLRFTPPGRRAFDEMVREE